GRSARATSPSSVHRRPHRMSRCCEWRRIRHGSARVHVTATQLSVEVHGTAVQGCELELYGVTGRHTLRLDQPGTTVISSEAGLPGAARLWLKRGTPWLDYRSLDPHSGWTATGSSGLTGVDIDVPVDPQTAVEALISVGEGPRVEYKSKFPGKAAAE